jgi:N-acylglucosamine-6-phosphate 2-epimerase
VTLPRFDSVFRRGIIVSCQAPEGDPLRDPKMMAAMARAAELAGAAGIRANGSLDVPAIKASVALPVIAILKEDWEGFEVRITPTFEAAHDVSRFRPEAIAIDGTQRPRPRGDDLGTAIRRIHEELGTLVMADCATLEEGLRAADLGADAVGTTLSGYTRESPKMSGPDLGLVEALVKRLGVPVVAEGRYEMPEHVAAAFARGAHAIVIGTAITRPQIIAGKFIAAVPPQ